MTAAERLSQGPICQYAYVVDDLPSAIDEWLSLGVGPWLLLRSFSLSGSIYRGRPSEPVATFAFANSGELQIELVHQEDDAPSAYQEFLEAGGAGLLHHVGFRTMHFEACVAAAERSGLSLVFSGDSGGFARFAYLQTGGMPSPYVEVLELSEVVIFVANMVRAASMDWDGSDAVRSLF